VCRQLNMSKHISTTSCDLVLKIFLNVLTFGKQVGYVTSHHIMLELDTAYLCTKVDHSSFSRSGDIFSARQNLNGSLDLTTPLQRRFAIRGLALAMINLSTKFEVCISSHYEDMKTIQMLKMGWFGIAIDQSWSLEVAPFDRAHTSSY